MANVKVQGSTQGVNPTFLTKFLTAVASVGGTKVKVISGYRAPGQTFTDFYGKQVTETSGPHNLGLALDSTIYIPGRGWVPGGVALKNVASQFGLRSGDQAGFYRGNPDPNHVDMMTANGTKPAGVKTAPSGALSFAQVEGLWVQAGGSSKWAPTMAAISMAESSADPTRINNTAYPNRPNYHPPAPGNQAEYSVGLMQINIVAHPQYTETAMLNPLQNMQAAVSIGGANGERLNNWSTYKNGAFFQYLNGGKPVGGGTLNSGTQNFLSDPLGVKGDLATVGKEIMYVAVILGGGTVIILGLLMIGLDLGLSGFHVAEKTAPVKIARAVTRNRRAKASGAARSQSQGVSEGRKQELHEARVKTEKARATDLRSRSRARTTAAKQTKAERTAAEKSAYIRGAADAESPTLTSIRRKKAS